MHIPVEAQLSDEATDLILKLCTSAANRLGRKGADSIKAHRFFSGFNFSDLRKQKAPYRPYFRDALDTSNFDPVEPPERQNYENNDYMTPSEDQQGSGAPKRDKKIPEHAFFEFTFRRFDEGNQMLLPFWPIIHRDGTLKFSSLKNNKLTEAEYSAGDADDDHSGLSSPREAKEKNTKDEKKEAAVYV